MKGLLLINLGTPDAPRTAEVRRYLAEFLSDPRVLDMNPVGRWLLLHGVILRTRPAKSAHAYQQIWTEAGSPLLLFSQDLAAAMQEALGQDFKVDLGMRYGEPRIADALSRLQQAGCDDIVVVPLYPQFSSAATTSALDAMLAATAQLPAVPTLHIVSDFYDDPGFVSAVAGITSDALDDFDPDHILFSYHGLPERQVKATELGDDKGVVRGHCLGSDRCCDAIVHANRYCYRAQCFATTRAVAAVMGLDDDSWSVSFQSRLGRIPWIRPYTDEVMPQLAQAGVKRLAVLSPSFTADCLETLEELGIRGREDFLGAGGEDYRLVPCVNADPRWVAGLSDIVRRAAAKA